MKKRTAVKKTTAAAGPFEDMQKELSRLRADLRRRDRQMQKTIDELRAVIARREEPIAKESAEAAEARSTREAYARVKKELRDFVRRKLPRDAAIAVVSRGDAELLIAKGRRIEHFPQSPDGGFAGYYPPDGTAIIAHLESLRAGGIDTLIFPETARWWLDAYPQLARHLDEYYRLAHEIEDVCIVFDLHERADGSTDGVHATIARNLDALKRSSTAAAVSVLDWETDLGLASAFPNHAVFSPPGDGPELPYLDASVDVVVLRGADADRLSEARRVARTCVVHGVTMGATGEAAAPTVEYTTVPTAPCPAASIIIPTYNGITHLEPCLRAVEETLPVGFDGEVIVIDDASNRRTAERLESLQDGRSWLRVARNSRNLGFISSCNRGARIAKSEYLVFLNDDTVPQNDWLTSLLGTFHDFSDAGAVGGRLVYPDGRLQEAGAVIFRDGSGANFGKDDYEVDAPLYTYVRPVSYCSGALLATPTDLFRDLGGFDRRFRPAYYEDTDYCFKVRDAGRAVYYQPDCVVVHLEGASSGTDTTKGVKRHQAVNRRRFERKWRHRLGTLPEPPARFTRTTWHELAVMEVA